MKKFIYFTGVALVFYSLIYGLLKEVPRLPILHETIRNLFYHVTMWFSMIFMFGVSLFYSIKYLKTFRLDDDIRASQAAYTGLAFGVAGLLTGMLWARYTWGTWWTKDPQLNGAAITMLAYFSYHFIRQSIADSEKKARLSAVYNIFAFALMIIFIGVLPRMNDSLHPGKGGNPGFNTYDMDTTLRVVFYPALIGWMIIAHWIWNLRIRITNLENRMYEE